MTIQSRNFDRLKGGVCLITICILIWGGIASGLVMLFIEGFTSKCSYAEFKQIVTSPSCMILPASVACKSKQVVTISGNMFKFECVPGNKTIHKNKYTTQCLNICVTPINGTALVDTVYVNTTYTNNTAAAWAMILLVAFLFVTMCLFIPVGMLGINQIDDYCYYRNNPEVNIEWNA